MNLFKLVAADLTIHIYKSDGKVWAYANYNYLYYSSYPPIAYVFPGDVSAEKFAWLQENYPATVNITDKCITVEFDVPFWDKKMTFAMNRSLPEDDVDILRMHGLMSKRIQELEAECNEFEAMKELLTHKINCIVESNTGATSKVDAIAYIIKEILRGSEDENMLLEE